MHIKVQAGAILWQYSAFRCFETCKHKALSEKFEVLARTKGTAAHRGSA